MERTEDCKENKTAGLYFNLISAAAALLFSLLLLFVNQNFLGDKIVNVSFEIRNPDAASTNLRVYYTENEQEDWKAYSKSAGGTYQTADNSWTKAEIDIQLEPTMDDSSSLYKFSMRLIPAARGDGSGTVHHLYIRNLKIGNHKFSDLTADDFENIESDLHFSSYDRLNNTAEFSYRDGSTDLFATLKGIVGEKPELRFSYDGILLLLMAVAAGCAVYTVLPKFLKICVYRRRYKGASAANLVFFTMVIATVCIPAFHLDLSRVSQDEKRELATFYGQGDRDISPGKIFDKWFDDRFYGRKTAIYAGNAIRYNLNTFYRFRNTIRYGEWIYIPYEQNLSFEPDLAEKNRTNLETIARVFNKPVYVLVYPYGPLINSEANIRKRFENKTDEITAYFNESPYLRAFDVTAVFDKYKGDYVHDDAHLLYYRDEHHATEFADWLVISELIKQNVITGVDDLEPESVTVNCVYGEIQDICPKYGQSFGYLFGTARRFEESPYFRPVEYVSYARTDKYRDCVSFSHYRDVRFMTEIRNKCVHNQHNRVAVIGNSFVENLAKTLANKLPSVLRVRPFSANKPDADFSRWKDQVAEYNPDYIIAVFYWYEFQSLNIIQKKTVK